MLHNEARRLLVEGYERTHNAHEIAEAYGVTEREVYRLAKHRRDIQKANGMYRAVWNRQHGRYAYYNNQMRPDQEVDVIEEIIGKGWKVKNLIYIHRQCAYDVYSRPDSKHAITSNFVNKNRFPEHRPFKSAFGGFFISDRLTR